MKISIIIPSYRPQDYIWECLDSIKNQTFPKEDFELILILNGCKEPYYTQIQKYITDKFAGYNVCLVQTDLGGVSNARNLGLDHAKGEYIAFIDDDDYVSPKYLEELYDKVTPNTVSLCYPYMFNDGNPEIQLHHSLTEVYDKYHNRIHPKLSSRVRKYFGGPCMKLVSKNIIGERRFDRRFKNGEDSIFMFLVSDKIEGISFSSEAAVYYRRYRVNSACTRERSVKDRVRNDINCIAQYTKIYFSGRYNFLFYITRVAAGLKEIFNVAIRGIGFTWR